MITETLADLKSLLQQYGFTGATIQLSRLEDSPDAALALISYAGGANRDLTGHSIPVLNTLSVQVLVRVGKDAGVATAMTTAESAWRILTGRHLALPPTGGGAKRRYDWIRAEQAPYHLGFDENDRPIVAWNLNLQQIGDASNPQVPAPPPGP